MIDFHHHWLVFGAAFLIVIAVLMIGVAVQEWWIWRKRP